MKKKKENYLVKGVYDRPQSRGGFAVKQYILIEQDGKHCLLLKFENESDMPISEAEFTVCQLDADGNEIGNIDICYRDIFIEPRCTYCADQGIVVDHACADCIVDVKQFICGRIKYVLKGGEITGHYDIRGYRKKGRVSDGGARPRMKRRYLGGGRFYGLIAFISLVLAVSSIFFVKYKIDEAKNDEAFRTAHASERVSD